MFVLEFLHFVCTGTDFRKASTENDSLVLYIDSLSRNVNEGHLREIFSNFGEVVDVELVMDRAVNLPRGSGYVRFKTRADAEKAQLYMDGAQIDGNVVHATFTLSLVKKVSPPPKPVAASSKRDSSRTDNVSADIEKDGPKRPREPSPRRKPPPSPRRRSPGPRRGGSPRRPPDSPPRRRIESPIRRRLESPYRRGETPPRRRPASSPRGRSPSPPPRRHRSPARASPRRMRGSPIRRRSPLPPRRRSPPPRRARSPPRKSPLRRRTRSPIRRPLHSRSRSLSPRRYNLIERDPEEEGEGHLPDVGDHHPTLHHLVRAGRYLEGYQGVVVLKGLSLSLSLPSTLPSPVYLHVCSCDLNLATYKILDQFILLNNTDFLLFE
ncbi:hypothetical protein WN943_014769 [Citrus x changshan-huyou]